MPIVPTLIGLFSVVADEPVEFENNQLKFKSSDKLPSQFEKNYRTHPNLCRKTNRCQHVTGWTWKTLGD